MKTSKKILNTEVWKNEEEEIEVAFEFSTDKEGRYESHEIKKVEVFVPAAGAWISFDMDIGMPLQIYSAAEKMIKSWLEKNHYNETSEFRRRLDQENNCED